MAKPLEGIRVIDWTQWQMGTSATAMLADLGAEVIHLEHVTQGDPGRGIERIRGVPLQLREGRNAYFEYLNRGKKSIAVDVGTEKGKEAVYRLVSKADVFAHNFRQGVPEKVGLGYEVLSSYNPGLIYLALSGYGPKGPDAQEPAMDYPGMARSGIMNIVGVVDDQDSPPLNMVGGIADQMGAIMGVQGILLGLLVRERLGIGQKIDVSFLGGVITLEGLTVALNLFLDKELPRPNRRREANPLWNHYQCKDGKWLALGMLQSERYWPVVCRGLGMEHLENDPRFASMELRQQNCEELIAIMDGVFVTKSYADWIKTLKEAGDIICGPVQTIPDLAGDPQVLANEYITERNHRVLGPVKIVGLPYQLSKTPGEVRCEAPEFGEHTEEVLLQVGGYTWEEIAELREEGAI